MKRRALRRVKQQVSTLLRGEDLPEGAQAREVAEVPLSTPSSCKGLQGVSHLPASLQDPPQITVPYGSAQGREKFPCEKCGKVLATRKMWKAHTAASVQGKRVPCSDCDRSFSSKQGMRQHFRVTHGAEAPERDESFLCNHCAEGVCSKEEHAGAQWGVHWKSK